MVNNNWQQGNPRKSWILDSRYLIPDVSGIQIVIPNISRIPDSSCRITDYKSQDSAFHKQIIPPIRVSGLPCFEGNNSHKQTNKINYILWSQIDLTLSEKFGTSQAIKTLPQKILTYYCLKMQKSKKRNNEMPKGTRLGKTEQDNCIQVNLKNEFVHI